MLANVETASRLLSQLSPYLLEAHTQAFAPSPRLRSISPSPHEALSYRLTSAILAIGIKHRALHARALTTILEYVSSILKIADSISSGQPKTNKSTAEESPRTPEIACVSTSLLGFLDATSQYTDFYEPHERLDLLRQLRLVLNEVFMVAVEGSFSSIRTSDNPSRSLALWKSYTRRYAASGRPLGATLLQCGFLKVLVSSSSLQICSAAELRRTDCFQVLLSDQETSSHDYNDADAALLDFHVEVATESMHLLEDGADYLRLGSAWQQRLAFSVKAYTLQTFLHCMVIDEEIADVDVLMSWLEESMADSIQMADDTLASVVLKSMAVIAKFSSTIASTLSRSLPRFIVQSGIKGDTVVVAARSLTFILRLLSQDAVITGLYSLGNVLSAGSSAEKTAGSTNLTNGNSTEKAAGQYTQHSTGSTISLDLSGEEETSAAYGNVVRAIVTVADCCQDEKLTALAQTMLLQKLGKISIAVDINIIAEAAPLALAGGPTEFKTLLKLYARLGHEGVLRSNDTLIKAIRHAQFFIAKSLKHESPLFSVYLVHLLETIIIKGDVHESDNSHKADIDLAAREIIELVPILAKLVSVDTDKEEISDDENVARLHREAWFNVVVHGITLSSSYGQGIANDLAVLAMQSRPLIAEERADQFESEVELNTVLRRGMNGPNTAEQKKRLIQLLPRCEADIRSLSYPKVVFLNAVYLVETLRAGAGDCSHILTYFLDPSLNGNAMENCMGAVADEVMTLYLRKVFSSAHLESAAPSVAKQLAAMFSGCCHRIPRVQQIAASCADRIVNQIPSALCQKASLFTLLELLTLMWTSCLEAELDEYELKANYSSTLGNVAIELSDDYDLRRRTLNNLHKWAKGWVTIVLNIAPLDIKGLLQTYLAEYDDEGTYGHVSLGRSFALDVGSMIPATEQKLGAMDRHGETTINTASDFIAQYTTRQEYKYADVLPNYDESWAKFLHIKGNAGNKDAKDSQKVAKGIEDEVAVLALLERRSQDRKYVSIGELRDLLRRAAALVCRSKKDQCAIIQHLVNLPFVIFTKQSIKLGISLWLGVINENPSTEPRILATIAENWEKTVRKRIGVFSPKLRYVFLPNVRKRRVLTALDILTHFISKRNSHHQTRRPL